MHDQRGMGHASTTLDDYPRQMGKGVDVGAIEGCLFVDSVSVNGTTEKQRSMVTSVQVTFTDIATFTGSDVVGAFELKQIYVAPGYNLGIVVLNASATVVSGKNVITLTFPDGPFVETMYDSLKDGVYALTIFASHFDPYPNYFTCGMNYPYSFHRLFGDADGSGGTQSDIIAMFRTTFGLSVGTQGYLWYFDQSSNQNIDSDDFGAFRARFGLQILTP